MILLRFTLKSTLLLTFVSLSASLLSAAESSARSNAFADAMNKGFYYAHAGENARALARFKEAVRLNPRSAEAHTRLALTYCDRSMYMAAEESARKAVLLDEKFSLGWLVLGTAQFYGDKEKEAISSLHKALRLDKKNAHITYSIGRCYYYMGSKEEEIRKNKSKALEYFKQTLRLSPAYIEARFMEGCCFLDLDMPDVARDSFLTALRAYEINDKLTTPAEIYFRLGICAMKSGRFVEAERRFRETLFVSKGHYLANLYLADLFMDHLPEKEQAILYYKRFMDTAPHNYPDRERVQQLLKNNQKK
ncbi:MAG: tetratricopeptide repeat protein [Planctomycetota bacterium]